MVVAAMKGADQHIRSSLGFSILPKDTSTCRPGESNQQPSNNNTLILPPVPQLPPANFYSLDASWMEGRLVDSKQTVMNVNKTDQ